jgi:hypothetical protein
MVVAETFRLKDHSLQGQSVAQISSSGGYLSLETARCVPVGRSVSPRWRSTKKQKNNCDKHCDGDNPPEPVDTSGHRSVTAKLTLYEILVIKLIVRQAETIRLRSVGPTGLLVRAAFGTSPGIGRDFRAAVRAYFGGHGQFMAFPGKERVWGRASL